jgi:hypothetical protein
MIVIGFLSHDQSTIGKTFSKVLPFVHDGGPKGFFVKPNVETFFDLTICSKTE